MVAAKFHITALTPPTITRARGLMAYEQLRSHLHSHEPVEIDLRGEYPLSLSFLDEFIRHLLVVGHLNHLTFVVKGGEALRKLARVAEIRRVDIWYRDTDSPQRRRVDPLPATATESVFLEEEPENDAR
jgi:hypothetical protein